MIGFAVVPERWVEAVFERADMLRFVFVRSGASNQRKGVSCMRLIAQDHSGHVVSLRVICEAF